MSLIIESLPHFCHCAGSFTLDALVKYGLIKENQVVSQFDHRLEHGYPVPFVERDDYLSKIQPWLQSNGVYSRERFGGWRYEVGNQDHSFMQGVEVADLAVRKIPEETCHYSKPSQFNESFTSCFAVLSGNQLGL